MSYYLSRAESKVKGELGRVRYLARFDCRINNSYTKLNLPDLKIPCLK